LTAALLIAVNIINIACDDVDNKGVKREVSARSVFDSFNQFGSFNLQSQKMAMGKTTVEYWPPDLDKKKFYNIKKDSVMELWPKDMSNEMLVRINEPIILTASASLPDIPLPVKEKSPFQPVEREQILITEPMTEAPLRKKIKTPPVKFETMPKSTEISLIEEMAITNRSPIVFPTSEPTTQNPVREVAFVSRGGNKKRKLKKKVKPAAEVPSAEAITPFKPSVGSAIEVMPNGEQPKIPQIYEYVDEPVVNIFQPIRYTDVINKLSSLTAQSFGTKNDSKIDQIIDNASPVITNITSMEESKVMDMNNGSMNGALEINLSMDNSLSPIDIMLDQLKLAIEERDLKKIKNIVQSMNEDEKQLKEQNSDEKPEKKVVAAEEIPTTTELIVETSTKLRSKIYMAPKVRTSTTSITESPTTEAIKDVSNTEMSTEMSLEIPTTVSSRIYLAPRVRAAQKKQKQVKSKLLSDEIPKESLTEAVTTEIPTTLKPTTEKRNSATVAKAEPLNLRPTKRKRSHVTPRKRNVARTVTKSSHKQNRGRRSGRKQ
jgi:hypothetical protein